MGVPHHQIKVLAEMIEEFDVKQPKPGRATTAFIKRWRAKELEEKHSSRHHLQIALRDINPAEIQNIRETKKFRDKQKEKGKQGQRVCGKIGGKASARKRRARPLPKVKDAPVRNVIW